MDLLGKIDFKILIAQQKTKQMKRKMKMQMKSRLLVFEHFKQDHSGTTRIWADKEREHCLISRSNVHRKSAPNCLISRSNVRRKRTRTLFNFAIKCAQKKSADTHEFVPEASLRHPWRTEPAYLFLLPF